VFGILKRDGTVYTQIIENTRTDTRMPIIRSQIKPDSIVSTDSYRSYNALDISAFKHYRINHSAVFAEGRNYINGIENFWNQAKRVLRKYNGIPAKHFYWFLKESEFRFNDGTHQQQFITMKRWYRLSLIYVSPLIYMHSSE
jgi:transposase